MLCSLVFVMVLHLLLLPLLTFPREHRGVLQLPHHLVKYRVGVGTKDPKKRPAYETRSTAAAAAAERQHADARKEWIEHEGVRKKMPWLLLYACDGQGYAKQTATRTHQEQQTKKTTQS